MRPQNTTLLDNAFPFFSFDVLLSHKLIWSDLLFPLCLMVRTHRPWQQPFKQPLPIKRLETHLKGLPHSKLSCSRIATQVFFLQDYDKFQIEIDCRNGSHMHESGDKHTSFKLFLNFLKKQIRDTDTDQDRLNTLNELKRFLDFRLTF